MGKLLFQSARHNPRQHRHPLQSMPNLRSIDIVSAFAKWHPGLLMLLVVAFGLCFVLSLSQFATGRGAPIGLLLVGALGVTFVGKVIARKYARELAQSKSEQDKLNS